LLIFANKFDIMETVRTNYLGNLRTSAQHVQSSEILITDAPVDNQGRGEAFSPTDLLATALGSCMLTIMGIAAREHNFCIDGTRVNITKIMASNPRRVSGIVIELFFPSDCYSEKHKKIIQLSAETCPVALSLHPDLKQTVKLHFNGS
jgi:putative redox protein